jgi:hypothetical protein
MQYFEDMGNSVVALKYESFLSPFQLSPNKKPSASHKKTESFQIKPVQIENKHENLEDFTSKAPITFLPLPSPHLGNNVLKFPKFFKRIKEEEEEENEICGNTNTKNQMETQKIQERKSEEPACKKKIFEEFYVFGIEKNDFMAGNIDKEKIKDGFAPAKILYYFDGMGIQPSDW